MSLLYITGYYKKGEIFENGGMFGKESMNVISGAYFLLRSR